MRSALSPSVRKVERTSTSAYPSSAEGGEDFAEFAGGEAVLIQMSAVFVSGGKGDVRVGDEAVREQVFDDFALSHRPQRFSLCGVNSRGTEKKGEGEEKQRGGLRNGFCGGAPEGMFSGFHVRSISQSAFFMPVL